MCHLYKGIFLYWIINKDHFLASCHNFIWHVLSTCPNWKQKEIPYTMSLVTCVWCNLASRTYLLYIGRYWAIVVYTTCMRWELFNASIHYVWMEYFFCFSRAGPCVYQAKAEYRAVTVGTPQSIPASACKDWAVVKK